MKKKKYFMFLVLCIAILGCCFHPTILYADDLKQSEEVCYDLNRGGKQVFYFKNKNGDLDCIIIEELTTNAKINNGSYKVSYSSTGAWSASFKVSISSNKFTSVYDSTHNTIKGQISSTKLSKNSNTKATYSFIYSYLGRKTNTGVCAIISNSELKVSQL